MLFTGSFTALEIYCRVNIQEGYQLVGESLIVRTNENVLCIHRMQDMRKYLVET